jgi:proteic killer suppression protein
MIKSFTDKETQKVFRREHSKKLPEDIQRRALRKLMAVDFADELRDLRTPPGNRLEKLHGEREGQHSIRINRQWRICFEWRGGDAHLVEIVDYH